MLLVFAQLCPAACQLDSSQFAKARAAYFEGVSGNQKQVDEAAKLFDSLHAECLKEPAVLAYWGSLKLLQASRTWAIWRKNSLSREGLTAVDEAVQHAPGNLEIRFVRAATTYDLPGLFHREEQCRSDFAYLASRVEQAARDGRLDPKLAAAALYYEGEFQHRDSRNQDAMRDWKVAIRIAPESRAARQSTEALQMLQRGGT